MDYNKDRRSIIDKSTLKKQYYKNKSVDEGSKKIKLDVGTLTPELINLIFKNLPFDISYVDEFDRVQYYNKGEERIFPRSPGIIGRSVEFCHPPKSVDVVMQILNEFKEGRKDSAEFWFRMKDKFLYIQYFAVRDADNKYKGVLEVSQNVADIRELKGERRILDWN